MRWQTGTGLTVPLHPSVPFHSAAGADAHRPLGRGIQHQLLKKGFSRPLLSCLPRRDASCSYGYMFILVGEGGREVVCEAEDDGMAIIQFPVCITNLFTGMSSTPYRLLQCLMNLHLCCPDYAPSTQLSALKSYMCQQTLPAVDSICVMCSAVQGGGGCQNCSVVVQLVIGNSRCAFFLGFGKEIAYVVCPQTVGKHILGGESGTAVPVLAGAASSPVVSTFLPLPFNLRHP